MGVLTASGRPLSQSRPQGWKPAVGRHKKGDLSQLCGHRDSTAGRQILGIKLYKVLLYVSSLLLGSRRQRQRGPCLIKQQRPNAGAKLAHLHLAEEGGVGLHVGAAQPPAAHAKVGGLRGEKNERRDQGAAWAEDPLGGCCRALAAQPPMPPLEAWMRLLQQASCGVSLGACTAAATGSQSSRPTQHACKCKRCDPSPASAGLRGSCRDPAQTATI